MTYKNFYTANSIEPGDEFLVTFKVMIQYDGSARGYRCFWEDMDGYIADIPQGERMLSAQSKKAMSALMPVIHELVYGGE